MSRLKNVRDSEDGKSYRQGYEDGAKDAFDHAELDAFYAGVGYGKKLAGDKNIGFKNEVERERFEEGIQAKDKHFNSYRVEPKGFFERILDFFSLSNRKKRKAYKKVDKKIKRSKNKSALSQIKKSSKIKRSSKPKRKTNNKKNFNYKKKNRRSK